MRPNYLSFIARNRRFLGFGFLLALASSFGQTFFIALFGGHIRDEFGLSHAGFGAVYSAATVASGLLIVWAGTAIDRFDLRAVSVVVCVGLACACLGMAVASAVGGLFLALLGLRLTGQGLSGHISATSMAKYFGPGARGKALSIAALGYPAGEALLPLAAVLAVAAVGWRATWTGAGVALAVLLVPAILWLLRGHGARHATLLESMGAEAAADSVRQWRRAEVLRDGRFYLMLPAVLAPAFVNTGVFFHQAHISEVKGWSLAQFAGAFAVYAAATVAGAIAAGGWVDRFGAVRLMPAFLPPLLLGMIVLAVGSHPAIAAVYMALAGLTQGIASIVVQSMWAERYGVRHLGAIRALVMALMVLSTSLSPVVLGALFDAGVAVGSVATGMAAYLAVAALLLLAPPLRQT